VKSWISEESLAVLDAEQLAVQLFDLAVLEADSTLLSQVLKNLHFAAHPFLEHLPLASVVLLAEFIYLVLIRDDLDLRPRLVVGVDHRIAALYAAGVVDDGNESIVLEATVDYFVLEALRWDCVPQSNGRHLDVAEHIQLIISVSKQRLVSVLEWEVELVVGDEQLLELHELDVIYLVMESYLVPR